MKKLSIVLLCALASGLIFESAYAGGSNVCNFFLEHDNPRGLSGSLKAFYDELTITPTETLDVDVCLNRPSEFIPLSDFIDEGEGSKNLDGFELNLKQFSKKIDRFGLTHKMSKSDSFCKKRNNYYFTEMNYSMALSYKF